ncbi:hypothetical protein ACGFI9_31925 [Micromonospora sp. NPDC048930]|uniref:hypothetical protein n=1 Tax=Micromonospora sp. NPDC048930 TaxID=3364261 RepID=UPI0037102313
MPAKTPEERRAIGRIAIAARHHPNEPERQLEDRRTLRAAQAERYIRAIVDGAPPLTDDQRRRLAALLAPAPAAPTAGE